MVVVQDKIMLEQSILSPKTSGVVLHQGTVLKLVPDAEMPDSIAERGTWYNHVVYLPTRDENGKYVKEYALISQHSDVSIGYLPLTRENLLRVAFNCLGNRLGWGGMLGATDASSYCKAVYKCFGLDLPRNTSWQREVPNRVIDLSGMTDEEKSDFINRLPAGTLLYINGYSMIYIGNYEGTNFAIGSTGRVASREEEGKLKSVYGVAVLPLSTLRRNGNTFLNEIKCAVVYDNGYSLE